MKNLVAMSTKLSAKNTADVRRSRKDEKAKD